ncbi:MAG: hypothetical protein IPJ60_02110 [Sphingobacteriaceae bacterium]|nr:hypothetical protein [Sphingobacteriaceae bacterium]
MKNGFCKLITDKKGISTTNSGRTAPVKVPPDFSINLQQVDCENVDFQYLDYKYQQNVEMLIHDCGFTGNFSSDNYLMELDGNVLSKRIKIGGTAYLVNKEAHINTGINVNVPDDNYAFEAGKLPSIKILF